MIKCEAKIDIPLRAFAVRNWRAIGLPYMVSGSGGCEEDMEGMEGTGRCCVRLS